MEGQLAPFERARTTCSNIYHTRGWTAVPREPQSIISSQLVDGTPTANLGFTSNLTPAQATGGTPGQFLPILFCRFRLGSGGGGLH